MRTREKGWILWIVTNYYYLSWSIERLLALRKANASSVYTMLLVSLTRFSETTFDDSAPDATVTMMPWPKQGRYGWMYGVLVGPRSMGRLP